MNSEIIAPPALRLRFLLGQKGCLTARELVIDYWEEFDEPMSVIDILDGLKKLQDLGQLGSNRVPGTKECCFFLKSGIDDANQQG